ncbi:MAG: biotin transporter BioY [Clostridia bacterium]|nr:biotin transporter BioY [Clostridia bacterium]
MKHIKNLTVRAILAATICVIAPIAIPTATIPITASTLIILIVSACIGIEYSLPAVLLYIALGTFGLPVCAGFAGGLHILTGITGGFILGYIPCCAATGLICSRFPDKKYVYPLSMLCGILICYACGVIRYSMLTDSTILSSAAVCILPFIPGDIIKILVASAISISLKPRLRTIINNN